MAQSLTIGHYDALEPRVHTAVASELCSRRIYLRKSIGTKMSSIRLRWEGLIVVEELQLLLGIDRTIEAKDTRPILLRSLEVSEKMGASQSEERVIARIMILKTRLDEIIEGRDP